MKKMELVIVNLNQTVWPCGRIQLVTILSCTTTTTRTL